MSQQTIYAIIFLGIFLLLVGTAHFLYRVLKISSEHSRKFLHVSGGVLALCAPLFFTSHWLVLALCSLAFLLLLFTYLKHWLPAIHQINRKSIGSVIFPIPIYVCFLVAINQNDDLLFYLPISFLTISDTIAEWAGKKWGTHSMKFMNDQKTLAGATGFMLSSLFIAIGWGIILKTGFGQMVWLSIVASLIATATELISTKGLDNLTVPLITLACLLFLRSL
jgi:phytol kinase